MNRVIILLLTLGLLINSSCAARDELERWTRELQKDLKDIPHDLDLKWTEPFTESHVSFTEFCKRGRSRSNRDEDRLFLDALTTLSSHIKQLLRYNVPDKYVGVSLLLYAGNIIFFRLCVNLKSYLTVYIHCYA